MQRDFLGGLLLSTLAFSGSVLGGIYNANEEVTYKEYWVSHDEFTGGCGSHEQPEGTWYFEPSRNCTKVVQLAIPDDFSGALRAEIYIDLWRNRDRPSCRFTINGYPTIFAPDAGSDWSRTPYVGPLPLSLLRQGSNTLTFSGGSQYHVHDIAVRIYHDQNHPLLPGEGSDVAPPDGALTAVAAANGLFAPDGGGTLLVDDNRLTLSAEAQGASHVEFHASYYGYDEDNNDRFDEWHNLGRNSFNPGPKGTIDHIATAQRAPFHATWQLGHVPEQAGVRFKVRLVDGSGNVREAAGGISSPFELARGVSTDSYLINPFDDTVLHHGGTMPGSAVRQILLPDQLDGLQSAYLVGAFWRNPWLSLNGNGAFPAFVGEDSWTLSIRNLDPMQLRGGLNAIEYGHDSGFGEFIERPGPMVVLVRNRQIPAGVPFESDEFDQPSLHSRWDFFNPRGDGGVATTGSQLALSVAGGSSHDVWRDGILAPHLMQRARDEDFVLEVEFDSLPPVGGNQGVLVKQDENRFLRLELYRDETALWLFAAKFAAGVPESVINRRLGGELPFRLRVARSGSQWRLLHQEAGRWAESARFTHRLQLRQIGLHAGNSGSAPPTHTVLVGAFRRIDAAAGPDTTPPAVTKVRATVGESDAAIQWQTDERAVSELSYRPEGETTWIIRHSPLLTTDHLTVLRELQPGTYLFRLAATDASGNRSEERENTFIILPDGRAPAILEPSIVPDETAATVSWITDEAATGEISWGATADLKSGTIQATEAATTHQVVLEGLTPATSYWLRIAATDAQGNRSDSDLLAFSTSGAAGPDASAVISSLEAFREGTLATIRWSTDKPTEGAVEYGLTPAYDEEATDALALTFHLITLGGLDPGKDYHFRVRAADAAGNLAFSPDQLLKAGASTEAQALRDDRGGGCSVTTDGRGFDPMLLLLAAVASVIRLRQRRQIP